LPAPAGVDLTFATHLAARKRRQHRRGRRIVRRVARQRWL